MEEGDDRRFMEMKFLTNSICLARPASMRNQQEIIGEEKLIFRNKFQP